MASRTSARCSCGRAGEATARRSLHSEPYKPRGGPDGGQRRRRRLGRASRCCPGVRDLVLAAPTTRISGASHGGGGPEHQARRGRRRGPRAPRARRHGRLRRDRAARRPGRRGRPRGRGPRRSRGPGQRARSPARATGCRASAEPGEAGRGAATSRSSCAPWPTSGSSACRTPGSPRCSRGSPPRGPRSPTTRSRRSRPTSAWRAGTRNASSWPTSPGSWRARTRARGSATGSFATSCDAGRSCCVVDLSRRIRPPTSRPCARRSRPTTPSSPRGRRSSSARRPTSWTTPIEDAAGLGPDALVVSAMTGEGIDDAAGAVGAPGQGGGGRSARARGPRGPAARAPEFTVTRDDAGRWHVAGRGVERWVMEADLDDEGDAAELRASPEEGGRRAQARRRWAPATATRS